MTNWYVENFAPILLKLEQEMFDFCQTQPRRAGLFWEMVQHHFNWSGGEAPKPSGKRLRPILMILVAKALQNGRYEHLIPAAVGIELLHNFTLIHDDVMDQSPERRHRPTVWTQWGVNQAINAGDGLYTLALEALLHLRDRGVPAEKITTALGVLLDACRVTVEGQVLDLSFEARTDVSAAEYLHMIECKTGFLIRASARIGALLSTDDPAVIEAYSEFAAQIGVAFQIWDDYLGVWGEEKETGKSASSDIVEKKKSYPVLYAFEQRGADLTAIYAKPHLAAEDVVTVKRILREAGAEERTRELTENYHQKAMAALDGSGIENAYQKMIRDLAVFFVQRRY